jgi:hypothetical protein
MVKEGCGLPALEQPFLIAPPDGHNNFNGDLGAVAACLVRVGESGCGLEEQLASLATGLGSAGAFLRPDAKLLVFLDTDEDDCSVPPDSDLFVDETNPSSLTARCEIGGLQCGGQPLSGMPFSAPAATCGPRDDGKLIPVKDLVAQVKSVKRAGQILVSGQIPWSPDTSTYYFAPDSFSIIGFRLKAFIDAFGAEGSINVSMEELASRTRAFLQAP